MKKVWTISSVLSWTSNYFKKKGIETYRLDAEILLSKTLGIRRIDLYLKYNYPLNQKELLKFKELIKRRVKGEPIAYIIGEKEFYSLKFIVNKFTFIPRPETESLVEIAIERLSKREGVLKGLEIGTGTGCISITLTKYLQNLYIWANDISYEALKVARKNAIYHKVEDRIFFYQDNLFNSIKEEDKFDFVICNPPYIRTDEIEKLDVGIKGFEPRIAIDGGINGLNMIKSIIINSERFLNFKGLTILEIGYGQDKEIEQGILSETNYNWEWYKDLSGKNRILVLEKGSK